MQNNIPEQQNNERSIKLLAASSQLYSQAKLLQGIQVLMTVPLPLVLSISVIIFPNYKVWAAFYGIVASIIDVLLIQTLQKEWKKEAAVIQEVFDCELLEMEWNEFRTGDRPTPERINIAARRHMKHQSNLESLYNWYSPRVGKVPINVARVICQRTNIIWDSTLRRVFSNWLSGLTVAALLILVVVGLILKMNLETFLLSIMAPLTPTILWSIREIRKQRDSSDTLARLSRHVQVLWDNVRDNKLSGDQAYARSRELQDEIYIHRCSNQPILNFIHRFTRRKFESDMNVAAEELVQEALAASNQ